MSRYVWNPNWPAANTIRRLVDEVGLSPAEKAKFTTVVIRSLAKPPRGEVSNLADLALLMLLLTKLKERTNPFVQGALRKWRRVFRGANRKWLESECPAQLSRLAFTLWNGICVCTVDRERMGDRTGRADYAKARHDECESWHRLRNWPLDVPLDDFLARAVLHITSWPSNIPFDEIANVVKVYALQARERGRGMLAHDVKGPTYDRMEVYPLAICNLCGTEVGTNNTCECECEELPSVPYLRQRFDLEISRHEATMYRCDCEGPSKGMLFFETPSNRVCPAGKCGLPGRATTAFVRPGDQGGEFSLREDDQPVEMPDDSPSDELRSVPDNVKSLEALLEHYDAALLKHLLNHYDKFRERFRKSKNMNKVLDTMQSLISNTRDTVRASDKLLIVQQQIEECSGGEIPKDLQKQEKSLQDGLQQLRASSEDLWTDFRVPFSRLTQPNRDKFSLEFMEFVRKYGSFEGL